VIMKKQVHLRTLKEWEQSWKKHWQKTKLTHFEVAKSRKSILEEHNFLVERRTVKHEKERLKRITQEFEKGFKRLYKLGPAVTVFGSARFKPNHPYYKQARKLGKLLGEAGFTVLTGGGPGIMEAANRGAFENGTPSYGLNILLPHEQAPNPYLDENID